VSYRRRLQRLSATVFYVLVTYTAFGVGTAQQQTGPVDEPRSAQHESAPVDKGAKAITEQHDKCATRLIVNADALFGPTRWTLNYDAAETLEVLGPVITKAGSHPTRITANTFSSDSDVENLDVSQRRAVTVRTWLVNHHFVATNTVADAANQDSAAASQANAAAKASTPSSRISGQKNGTVEVILDTCH
jgi:outer membrane protein OmpA-like peptidoglycan-associated protein